MSAFELYCIKQQLLASHLFRVAAQAAIVLPPLPAPIVDLGVVYFPSRWIVQSLDVKVTSVA